jgi:putative transposase
LAKDSTIGQVCWKIDVTDRWRRDYGSLSVDQAKRLREVEKENVRLKKLVAKLSLGKSEMVRIISAKS